MSTHTPETEFDSGRDTPQTPDAWDADLEPDPADAADDRHRAEPGAAFGGNAPDEALDEPEDDDVDEEDADGDDDASVAEVPYEPGLPEDAPVPPDTGDAGVDEAMADLAAAQSGSFEERIEAGELARRMLQGRLGGLGEA